jgi:hypothetical protein
MFKHFLKYCLSFALILTAYFAIYHNSHNDIQLGLNVQGSNEQVKTSVDFTSLHFKSESNHHEKESGHLVFENEVDEDEIETEKSIVIRVAHETIFNHFRIAHYLSRVKNILPKYSFQANTTTSWYILISVFRI